MNIQKFYDNPEFLSRKKLEIIRTGRELYNRGYIVATDGNISLKLNEDEMLITKKGVRKGSLMLDDLIRCNIGCGADVPDNASSETLMHRAVYEQRTDIQSVIHAHPPMVIACTLADIRLNEHILPEIVKAYGGIAVAAYAAPSSIEGAEAVREPVKKNDLIVLDMHGSLTVGKSLKSAFDKLERLEFYANIVINAARTGKIRTLTERQFAELSSGGKADSDPQ